MKIHELLEYGLSGPYTSGSTPTGESAMGGSIPGSMPTSSSNKAAQKIPILAPKVAPIKTIKDIPLPSKDNPKEPMGVYDKNKKLVAIAARPAKNKPPVFIDPKTKKPLQNLRGLYIQDPKTAKESVFNRFAALSLEEQLLIVEQIDMASLTRALNEDI
jgi:hypothetical protein